MSKNVIDIAGYKIDAQSNIILDGTKPVNKRYYRSSLLPENISCYDDHMYKYVHILHKVLFPSKLKNVIVYSYWR